ncbi:hypothetical protein [Fuerstiella marisgermanici]|uniref:DNA primase (Bacterial type) n=1 Tax=Fuerstiella marisgermanici TaxID=1891926 RepID=A0A1P8WB54_9PLAN|nr:hypothetical protein [Fuerstiella marisgermanici]APZ91307.1 DNA primase (bacterial type) [Fuerstiella marisgermanici]
MYPAFQHFQEVVAAHPESGQHIKQEGSGYVTRCPSCGKNRFSFTDGDRGVVMDCFSGGCSTEAICEALGVKMSQLFHDYSSEAGSDCGQPQPPRTTTTSVARNKQLPQATAGPSRKRAEHDSDPAPDPVAGKKVHKTVGKAFAALGWSLQKSGTLPEAESLPHKTYTYFYADGSVACIVCRYNFTTADGGRDKTYRQVTRVKDDGWQCLMIKDNRPLYGLLDVLDTEIKKPLPSGGRAFLTGLPEITSRKTVYVNEGEKAAAALRVLGVLSVSPSNGAKSPQKTDWRPLNGLRIVILPDNDESGENFAKRVIRLLRQQCPQSAIEVRKFADDPEFADDIQSKDDAADWCEFYERRDRNELLQKLVSLPDRSAEYPETAEQATTVVSRGEPLANHETETTKEDGGDGKETVVTTPLSLQEIKENLHAATGGWPKVTRGRLFVHEGDEDVRFLESPHQLFAWIGSRMNAPPHFKRDSFLHTKEEFYQHLIFESEEFSRVETFPEFPQQADVYYAHRELETGDGSHLEKMLDYFLPATDADRTLIKSMICTLVSGIEYGQRPLFVISSPDRNAGKTSLAQNVSLLVGGFLKWSERQDFDKFGARLLSSEGRAKRVVLIDNVKSGRFSHDELESVITLETISGRQNNVGESSRQNNLNWILTVNGPSMSRDISTRAIPIQIRMPKRRDDYTESVRSFIREHLWDILEDCIAELQRPVQDVSGSTRFDSWDRGVLKRLEGAGDVLQVIASRQGGMDVDFKESGDVESYFDEKLSELGYLPETDIILIPNDVATEWFENVVGRRVGTSKMKRDLNRMIDAGHVTRMHDARNSKMRGIGWNGVTSFEHCDVEDRILKQEGDDFNKRRGF